MAISAAAASDALVGCDSSTAESLSQQMAIPIHFNGDGTIVDQISASLAEDIVV